MLDNNFSSIRNALAKNASALKGVSVSAVYAATDVGNPPAHVAAAAAATTASSLADAETAVRTHAIENTQLRYLVAELRAQLASQEEDAATDLERFRRQAEIHATLLAAAHSEASASRDEMRRERELLKSELVHRDQQILEARGALARTEGARDAMQAEIEAERAAEMSRLETFALRDRINASVARAVLLREVRMCEEEAAAAKQAAADAQQAAAATERAAGSAGGEKDGGASVGLHQLGEWAAAGTRPEGAAERARYSLLERLARLEDAADAASLRFAALQRERGARRSARQSIATRRRGEGGPSQEPPLALRD